jgi:hypothetical protein
MAYLVHVGTQLQQHLHRHAVALAQHAEEDVLGADVIVAEGAGFPLYGAARYSPGA